MPIFLKVLSIVFPVFSIIGLGYVFARFKKINLDSVVEVLLYLTVPALVLSSLSKKPIVLSEVGLIAISACAVIFGIGAISFLYLSAIGRRDARGFYLPTMFMNSANIPFPIALLAFGTEGLAVAVIYYIVVTVLVFSVGVYIAKEKNGLGEIFKLPLLYAAIFGIGMNLSGYELPRLVQVTVSMLALATIPLLQISLGYYLYSVRLSDIKHSIAGAFIRILGGFAIGWLAVSILNIEGVTRSVIILTSSMPGAIINFIISKRYEAQSELVASIVAISTIVSIVTIPIILALVM